jgi:hypothetical protein
VKQKSSATSYNRFLDISWRDGARKADKSVVRRSSIRKFREGCGRGDPGLRKSKKINISGLSKIRKSSGVQRVYK